MFSSYLHRLECARCEQSYDPDQLQTFCEACQGPLMARYDLERLRREVDRADFSCRPRGMWRWAEVLPVLSESNRLALGEGDAPLLRIANTGERLGLEWLYVKDESQNPTGSFKARGLAAAVSKAKELGAERLIIPTAGNAGGALAAYAARGGLQACVVMPEDTPYANKRECEITGALVIEVPGLISDAARVASQKAQAEGWFDVSTFKEPYRTEGKKIMGYELAEAFDWDLPDVILYPTGGGTGLVGMWKAFAELAELGWLESDRLPRLVSVQAAGCAPVVKAWETGADVCEPWQGAFTAAAGLRVPKSFADREILHDLRASQGHAVAVSDEALLGSQQRLAEAEGIFAAPEGAATLAALERLVSAGWIAPSERVVLFNTGSGLKYL
jgi:threonine synthase